MPPMPGQDISQNYNSTTTVHKQRTIPQVSTAVLLGGVLWSPCKEPQDTGSFSGLYKGTQEAFAPPPALEPEMPFRQVQLKMPIGNAQFQIIVKV